MAVEPLAESLIDPRSAPLTLEERRLLAQVEEAHGNGLELKRWWEESTAQWPGLLDEERFESMLSKRLFRQHFRLMQKSSSKSNISYGLMDEVQLAGRQHPVTGVVQQMFFDKPRGEAVEEAARKRFLEIWRDNLREFVLGHFLRLSTSYRPVRHVEEERRSPAPYLRPLSWCPEPKGTELGLGFSQRYYKRQDNGQVGKFRQPDQEQIDLRRFGREYAWIVVHVRVVGYQRELKLAGEGSPTLGLPAEVGGLGIITPELLTRYDGPGIVGQPPDEDGILGRYGCGYTWFVDIQEKRPLPDYQSGNAAFKSFDFWVEGDGTIVVRVASVWCRPDHVLDLPLNPMALGLGLADRLSQGLFSPVLKPMQQLASRLPFSSFDPFLTYVAVANAVTGNVAAENLCISRDELDRQRQREHFERNRNAVDNARGIWREVGDWTQEDQLPR